MGDKEQFNEGPIEDWLSYLSQSKSHFQRKWDKDDKSKLEKKDFHFLRTIGKGGFSKVKLATKDTSYFAVKIIKKSKTNHLANVHQVFYEKRALHAIKFPFIIHMDYHFNDTTKWYFVMPYLSRGDLWYQLKKNGRFSENIARFYSSQVLLAIEYLHYLNIVYRDLKPENILVSDDGYIKLVDLGFCKKIKMRTYTMCGTIQYIAPEVLLSKGYGFPVDWWSFGVLLYELDAGYTPFLSKDEWTMCEKITRSEYIMGKSFTKELKDLILHLLEVDPTKRLGNLKNGANDIKSHEWFHDVNWIDVLYKRVTPPFIPENHQYDDEVESNSESSESTEEDSIIF